MTRPAAAVPVARPVRGRRELILEMLCASATPLSVNAIGEQLRVHPNTVRFHLDALIDAGRVERLLGEITGPGRPPILYRASRSMDRHGPSNYRLLAAMLTSHLAATADQPASTATKLGRRWGPSLIDSPPRGARAPQREVATKTDVLTQVFGLLDDLGFKPEPHKGGRSAEIRLRHCPFLDLVADHADVICSIHLGLMQGAMAQLNGPVTVNRLDPFVEPDLCVAHLASTRPRP
jgi:predicted ArsR family transcriptional regulator